MPSVTRDFSSALNFSLRAIGICQGGTARSTLMVYSPGRQPMESNMLQNYWMILFLSCKFPFRLDLSMGFMSYWDFQSSFVCVVSLFLAGAWYFTAKFWVTNPKSHDDWNPSNISRCEFTIVVPINLSWNVTPSQNIPSWSTVIPLKAINHIGVFLICTTVSF